MGLGINGDKGSGYVGGDDNEGEYGDTGGGGIKLKTPSDPPAPPPVPNLGFDTIRANPKLMQSWQKMVDISSMWAEMLELFRKNHEELREMEMTTGFLEQKLAIQEAIKEHTLAHEAANKQFAAAMASAVAEFVQGAVSAGFSIGAAYKLAASLRKSVGLDEMEVNFKSKSDASKSATKLRDEKVRELDYDIQGATGDTRTNLVNARRDAVRKNRVKEAEESENLAADQVILDGIKRKIEKLSNLSRIYNSLGSGVGTMFAAVGKGTAAFLTLDADRLRADAAYARAMNEFHNTRSHMSFEFASQHKDAGSDALHKMEECARSTEQTNRSIAANMA